MSRVLLIEDNAGFAFGLANNMEIEGYEVEVVADGREGLIRALSGGIDLIVLDLMLPTMDGFRVLQALREDQCDTPVLILSSKDEEVDKVRGFRFGADDYVTKPFGLLELMSRIAALLRRSNGAAVLQAYRIGNIEIDPTRRLAHRDGIAVYLAPLEFDLLLALLRRGGAVATRHELLTEVWGHSGRVLTRTVDTHIAQLRRKLESKPSEPAHILTVRKIGYRVQS